MIGTAITTLLGAALVLVGLAFILTLETSWFLRLVFVAIFATAILIGTI